MFKELTELFESQVLNEDTKTAIQEAFEAKLNEAREEIRLEEEAKATKKLVSNNKKLYETIKELVGEEFKELKEDVHQAKKDNIKNVKRFETFKEEYKKQLNQAVMETIKTLVEGEINELRVDLKKAAKNDLGMKVMEQFSALYREQFAASDFKELNESLKEANEKLRVLSEQVEASQRKEKISSLLENLTGATREAMEVILENTSTDLLDKKFEEALPIVTDEEGKKEEEETEEDEEKKIEEAVKNGKVVLEGKDEGKDEKSLLTEQEKEALRKLSGITK